MRNKGDYCKSYQNLENKSTQCIIETNGGVLCKVSSTFHMQFTISIWSAELCLKIMCQHILQFIKNIVPCSMGSYTWQRFTSLVSPRLSATSYKLVTSTPNNQICSSWECHSLYLCPISQLLQTGHNSKFLSRLHRWTVSCWDLEWCHVHVSGNRA